MSLPVFKAFGATFALFFGRLGDVIKIAWLPTLALCAASTWAVMKIAGAVPPLLAGGEPSDEEVLRLIAEFTAPIGITFLAFLVFYPMRYAGLLRFVVRGESPRLPFYLQIGGDELRIFLTYLVLFLIMSVALPIAIGVPQAIVGFALGGPGKVAAQASDTLFELLNLVLSIWLGVRFCLAYAAAIGELGLGIEPGWAASKGNFWSLFGFNALWVFLTIVGVLVAFIPFFAPLAAFVNEIIALKGNDEAIKELVVGNLTNVCTWLATPSPGWWLTMGVSFLITLVFESIYIMSFGVAYRMIKEADEPADAETAET